MVQAMGDASSSAKIGKIDGKSEEFLANALDAVKLSFVTDFDEIRDPTTEAFAPEFVHQHFGENETIFGYSNLRVQLFYTNPSMFIFPKISWDKDISVIENDIMADDIMLKLKAQLPSDQLSCMVQSEESLLKKLNEQKSFQPFGTQIDGTKQFQLYKVDESSTEFDSYLERLQTLALWYIDAAQYTDNTDHPEDPADNFIYVRDFVDCCNAAKLPEFAPAKLKAGFNQELRDAARTKLKVGARQSRRVYEILRLMTTNCSDAEELKQYRLDVKRRLITPMKRSDRDWTKLRRALNDAELTTVTVNAMNNEERLQQLQDLYEQLVEGYRITINRLKTFSEGIF